ncbi:hypothetical protein Nepgr_032645 [Nepenthes gracilis]|uniref:Pentatricopeptide repeat-containing protein n=1 Tax=Nepenthes gracilis TaxID=150966 RepID=A0AAD3TJV0_NEPGR|nr:hypothetical protein Nepgr_032645 [Nepenthes gracilis]
MLRLNCLPNNDTYVKFIGAFLKAEKVSDALEMFDAMLHRGIVPTSGILTSFIEPLCRYGPPHAAMIIYKNAKRIGCRISMSAYKLLLMRLSRFGKCGMLLQLWEDMQESGYSSDKEVYEYIINGLCNNGQLESAVLVVEESLRKGDIGVLMVGTFKPAICKYSGVRLKNWRTYALEVLRKHHHFSCGTVNINIYSALAQKVVEVELIVFLHGVENSLDQALVLCS